MIAWRATAGPAQPVKARASRDRLRRLAALTACRLPGSLPPCDHGLLRAIALP